MQSLMVIKKVLVVIIRQVKMFLRRKVRRTLHQRGKVKSVGLGMLHRARKVKVMQHLGKVKEIRVKKILHQREKVKLVGQLMLL